MTSTNPFGKQGEINFSLFPLSGVRICRGAKKIRILCCNLIPVSTTKRHNLPSVFVISTGRTGTKFLEEFFNKYSTNIRACHEPFPRLRNLGVDFARGVVKPPDVVEQIISSRNYYIRRLDRPCYLESNNRLFSLVIPLKIAFPKCKIIHIVRGPIEFVRSALAHGWYQTNSEVRIKPIHFPNDPWTEQWTQMTSLEKLAWLWQKQNRIMREAVAGVEEAITLRFEDLFDPNQKDNALHRVIDFTGAEVQLSKKELCQAVSRKVNISKKKMPRFKDWILEEKSNFLHIAGDEMSRYGYEGTL